MSEEHTKNGQYTPDKAILEYLDETIRHIQNVQQNCIILGKKLIDEGETRLGRMLIYNGFKHDVSKFAGIEWDYLNTDLNGRTNKEKRANFSIALKQHRETNLHHPEAWESIHAMSDDYLAEMVCDVKARSSEFGTDLRQWITEEATKKYDFKESDEVYKRIMRFVDLLLQKSF